MGGTFAAIQAANAAGTASKAAGAASSIGSFGGNVGSLLAVSQGLSSLFQIMGGVSAAGAASREAKLQQEQADLAYAENQQEITARRRDIERFKAAQTAAYLGSGVTLEGSPLLTLQETQQLGQEELDALQRRGTAIRNLGYQRASMVKNQGRSALLGAIGGGLMGGLNTFITGRRLGLFSTGKS